MSGNLTVTFVAPSDSTDDEIEKKPAGWDVVGGRVQTVQTLPGGENEIEVARAPEPEPSGIEVEIERPSRSREVEEASPADEWQTKWATERMAREEAVQAAYQRDLVLARTQEASQFDQHKAALEQEYARAHEALRAAQQRQAEANYNRNFEAAAEAGTEAAALVHRIKECEGAYERIEEQKKEMLEAPINVPQTTAQRFEAGVASAKLGPASEAWARHYQHQLMFDQDFYNNVTGTARQIESDGYVRDTPEYFQALNDALGTDYNPHEQQDHQPAPRQSRQRGGVSKRPVAAPGSRSSGRAPESRVHLNEFDLKTARELGIDPRTYARQYKSNANKNQYDKSILGGRLHASYSVNQYEDSY